MLNKKTPIIWDIKEPCFFDFLYEEIRQSSEIEILSTIVFESIVRTASIKKVLEQNLSAENILDSYLNNTTNNIIHNPVKKELDNFYLVVEKFFKLLNTLQLNNEYSISEDELIQIFFDKNIKSYKIVLDNLKEIKNILNDYILPNLKNSIKIESENVYQQEEITNPFKKFEKYGLDYNKFVSYTEELNNYLIRMNTFKSKLLEDKINIKKYRNSISKLVSEYKTFFTNQLFANNKIIITPGKRPISKHLNILQFTIPFYIDDTTKTRLLKSVDTIKKLINETKLKNEMKDYLKLTKKEYSKILTMKPEVFARTLFIYDWLEYLKNNNTDYNYQTQKEKIEYLQDTYPELKKINYKTLENEVNKFRKFIQDLSKIETPQAT